MATITIKITGTKETSNALKGLQTEFKDFTVPLENSSVKYLNTILTNFTDEGRTFNKPWPPLSPATIAIKKDLKAQGKSKGTVKPLYRTGKLRSSFSWDLKGKNESTIFNDTDYAQVHQEGGTVFFKGRMRKVPKRTLAEVDDKRKIEVSGIFVNWIQSLLKKYKAD